MIYTESGEATPTPRPEPPTRAARSARKPRPRAGLPFSSAHSPRPRWPASLDTATDFCALHRCSGQGRSSNRYTSSGNRQVATVDPARVGQVNVAVGDARTLDAAGTAIADYYAFTGHPGWDSPISEPDAIAETIDGYRQLGVDELVLYCYSDNADQIEELADLAL